MAVPEAAEAVLAVIHRPGTVDPIANGAVLVAFIEFFVRLA